MKRRLLQMLAVVGLFYAATPTVAQAQWQSCWHLCLNQAMICEMQGNVWVLDCSDPGYYYDSTFGFCNLDAACIH